MEDHKRNSLHLHISHTIRTTNAFTLTKKVLARQWGMKCTHIAQHHITSTDQCQWPTNAIYQPTPPSRIHHRPTNVNIYQQEPMASNQSMLERPTPSTFQCHQPTPTPPSGIRHLSTKTRRPKNEWGEGTCSREIVDQVLVGGWGSGRRQRTNQDLSVLFVYRWAI